MTAERDRRRLAQALGAILTKALCCLLHTPAPMIGCQVLAAGAIPVIAVDHYVLPFQSILDWDQFSIRIPEDRILDLPAILKVNLLPGC